jgi:hypothetical protein
VIRRTGSRGSPRRRLPQHIDAVADAVPLGQNRW